MTICPKCRENSMQAVRDWLSLTKIGSNDYDHGIEDAAKGIIGTIGDMPTHPQDAEARDGLARTIIEALPKCTGRKASVCLATGMCECAEIGDIVADAILAYLYSQGFRRVGDGGA